MTTTWNTISNLLGSRTASVASTGLWNLQGGTAAAPGLSAVSAWKEATGAGVRVGVFDDGDLHQTAVTGIIAARPSADAPIGVAYNANVSTYTVVGRAMSDIIGAMTQAVNYDVTNNSWGWSYAYYANRSASIFSGFFNAITDAADHGRGGLGTVQVVAGGNYRTTGGDTNISNFTNDRHVVTVGAVTSEGGVAYYSNPGASLLVSAPSNGGTKGITTTDLPGSAGYAAGSVTTTFGGTSAAAPQVTGTVALMLEANPNLGWRDVRTILAMSAEQPTAIATVTNGASNWNGGGMRFSNDTGYGVVDAHTAVRLAETWIGQNTSANELNLSVSATGNRTLNSSGAISYSFNVANAIDLETVEVTLQGSHSRSSDLVVQLVSPDGTVSTLPNKSGGSVAYSTYTLSSNAFLGEDGAGQWTLRVSEGANSATGTFTGATLALHGADPSANADTFVYTDAFSTLGDSARSTLRSTSGTGIINAAATTSDDVIDLHAGATSVIAGRAVYLTADSNINTAVAGDGNVKIIANDHGNTLVGGHGNDTFIGGAGNDTFISGTGRSNYYDGGAGIDTVVERGALSSWSVERVDNTHYTLTSSTGQVDHLVNVERVTFDGQSVLLDLDGNSGLAFRLYGAAFDRSPDAHGLDTWIQYLDQGQSIQWVADRFVNSVEFAQRYGSNIDDATFVTRLYENALHREPEAAGFQHWMTAIQNDHLTRADLLFAFSAGTENVQNHLAAGIHGALLA